jgi:23S rRNA pseudoU1915 N3-methylase RlmH
MMHEEKRRYEKELIVWRKRQLEIIRSKGGEELAESKKQYHEHVTDKERKHLESKKRKNVALVTLDEEIEEIVVGDVASFANNNKNILRGNIFLYRAAASGASLKTIPPRSTDPDSFSKETVVRWERILKFVC